MKKLLFFLLLFFSLPSIAQLESDSLSKYSNAELLEKASYATHFDSVTQRNLYYTTLFHRNLPDSLRMEIQYTIAFDYFSFTDSGIDFSIEAILKAQYYARKTKDLYSQVLCLDGLSLFYGMKNNDDEVLKCMKEIKFLLDDESFDPYEKLKTEAVTYRIYTIIGDFKRSNDGYRKTNKKVEKYLLENPDLPKEKIKALIYDIKANYSRLITNYNFQKKLDSSAYYIKKVKTLEHLGFDEYIPIWYQEAIYFILKKQYDTAIKIVQSQHNDYLMNAKNERQKAMYCLALCYESKGEFRKSLQICEKAFMMKAHNFSYQNLDIELLKIAGNCATKMGLQEKAKVYSKRYAYKLQELNYQKKAHFITSLYEQDLIAPLDQKLKIEKKNSGYYLSAGIILLVITSYLLWRFLKSVKDKRQFLKIISKFEEQERNRGEEVTSDTMLAALESENFEEEIFPETAHDFSELSEAEEHLEKENRNINISKETEKKILRMLDRFEKKEQFLSPNVTAGSLASDMNTNSVYLSLVLKKYKQNNFNGYINQLRINYIIHKLQHYPEYSTYKIAYLAEECGFTSHTSFNRIFIQLNGIPPSKFISLLGKQK